MQTRLAGGNGDGENSEGKLHLDQTGLPVQPTWAKNEHDRDPHQEPRPPEAETATGAEAAAAEPAGGTRRSC